MQMRLLRAKDAEAFREIRVRALRENPQFYPLLPEEVEEETLESLLSQPMEKGFVLGVFDPEPVAVAGLQRTTGFKRRHKAWIWGMYVAPEAVQHDVGRAVLKRVIDTARLLPELEQLHMNLPVNNAAARKLFVSVGFEPYGIESRSFRNGDDYLDEELLLLRLR